MTTRAFLSCSCSNSSTNSTTSNGASASSCSPSPRATRPSGGGDNVGGEGGGGKGGGEGGGEGCGKGGVVFGCGERGGGDDHQDINLTISMRLPFGKQDLQQLHRFALIFFSSRVQRLGELGRPALCRFLARRNDRVWHERLLVPRRGGRAPRVVAGDRSRSAIPGCVVLGRPLAPTLCRPAGPSHCTRCQLLRCCIACAHTVRPDWHLQLQVRQLRPNCDCCAVATILSSVRGP